jgi:LCP family protein required for cell wall assembly
MRRFLGGGVLIAVLTTVAVSTGVIEGISTVADAFDRGQLVASADLTPAAAGAPQTIMIVGSDKRSRSKDTFDRRDPPHTDTILLLRLDPGAGDITEMSVPRDLWVRRFTFRGTTYLNQKINYAYTVGAVFGRRPTAADVLALNVVKHALGNIEINDFIDLNFESFDNVVAKLGCVYVDVDHVYFHRNYAGEPSTQNYQAINIRPGYKPLCGDTALAYVRYRHDDNTFARDARQQDFFRQAKEQLGVTGLLSHYQDLLNALGRSVSTNIRGSVAVGRLLYLALKTLDGPVRQVQFPDDPIQVETANGIQDDQTASKTQIRRVVAQFENSSPTASALPGRSTPTATATSGAHHHSHHAIPRGIAGLSATPSSMTTRALELAPSLPFKVELPRLTYDWAAQVEAPYDDYAYELRDLAGHRHWAYHITWQDTRVAGGWYGLEGTSWTDPPLFDHADTRYHGGRGYLEVGNGHHIHDIGWIDHGILYWINNTLFDDLSDAQMVALAESARPVA